MLTKEEKLAILSKAIDEGAQIDVNFYDLSKGKAHELIKGFADEMDVAVHDKFNNNTYWYVVKEKQRCETLQVTAFYNPLLEDGYMVEDVKFEEIK